MPYQNNADNSELSRRGVICREFKAVDRNALRGFAELEIPSVGLVILDVGVFEQNGKRWVSLPSRPQIDRDRQVLTEPTGKIKYAPVMRWGSREIADRFSEAALAAIDAFQSGRR